MSLVVVSTPIGNYEDITLRAIKTLKNADVIICEELKPARILLKRLEIGEKELFQLNEHSQEKDLPELVELCRSKNVALISDCGTPGFCDPGAKLVEACAKNKITIDVNPGASSLMSLFALSGVELNEFHFVGFLPAEKEARHKKIATLKNLRSPFVIMDTPYRLQATLNELAVDFGSRLGVLGLDLTGEKHQVMRARISELASRTLGKTPFVLLVV
ncbi:MAG: SAM-dependent methyltransferase [Oligoflexia bacterium]|nr:SAM-dependent methyltransferase [Oligoflexia bacterium]